MQRFGGETLRGSVRVVEGLLVRESGRLCLAGEEPINRTVHLDKRRGVYFHTFIYIFYTI